MPKSKAKNQIPIAVELPLLLDIPTVANLLSTTKWQVRSLLWSNQIRHVKLGRSLLIDRRDLIAFVDSLRSSAL